MKYTYHTDTTTANQASRTFHEAMIKISHLRPDLTYLELGVGLGSNFASLPFNAKESVDVKQQGGITTHVMTTNDFFAKIDEKKSFDVIYIDADHRAEQVLQDYNNSITHLARGGIIVIHDLYPPIQQYCDPKWCGDGYRVLINLILNHGKIWVNPWNFGCTIIEQPKQIPLSNVTYSNFVDMIENQYNKILLTTEQWCDKLYEILVNNV